MADHPRSRGVYFSYDPSARRTVGSSPLARGLQLDQVVLFAAAGIIPARAGFTQTPRPRSSTGTDHPRSRGVYADGFESAFVPSGSSPLARGLPRHPGAPGRSARIIPARAGFTMSPESWVPVLTDHPRSRGVYDGDPLYIDVIFGSSPLARGLRGLPAVAGPGGRIIPARAGFTRWA